METFGLRDPNSSYAGIDYNERSPLVVPPTRDLPPPEASTAPPAPNWPKDQDMIRRAKAKAQEKKVAPHPDYVSDSSRPLRPNELDPAGAPRVNTPIDSSASANAEMSDPRDHGVKKSLFSGMFSSKTEYTTFTGEPSREALTDPPPGYLTPSPDQPYGVGPAKSDLQDQDARRAGGADALKHDPEMPFCGLDPGMAAGLLKQGFRNGHAPLMTIDRARSDLRLEVDSG